MPLGRIDYMEFWVPFFKNRSQPSFLASNNGLEAILG